MYETYTNLLEWSIIWAFLLLVAGFMFAEAFWISRTGWASFGKSFVFAALTNVTGFSIGLFVLFVVLAIFMMLALDGSLSAPMSTAKNGALIAVLVFAALPTPILLIIGKRIFLSVLKIQTGKTAWIYALASSILIFAVSLGVPILIVYFAF